MSIERWQPFNELRRMHDEMDRMFESFLQPSMAPSALVTMTMPLVDVFEQDRNIIVKAEVPGLNKDNIEVMATEDSITMKGEFKQEEEVKEQGFIRQERRMGNFFRTIPLSNKIKSDQVKAVFKDGVLTITAPMEEEANTKETKVNIES